MKNIRFTISVGIILSFASITIGQTFKDGFIIQSQDTIYGQVKLRSNAENYLECVFMQRDGEPRSFKPSQITGFGYIGDKYFQSGYVKDEFLEVIIDGRLSFLSGSEGYYLLKEGKLIYLENQKESKGKKQWKGRVSYAVGSCLDTEELEKMKYSEKSISEVIIKYHECNEEQYYEPRKNIPWIKLHKGIIVSYSTTKINSINVATGFNLTVDETYESNAFLFGLAFNWTSPRSQSKLSFHS